MSVWDKVDFSKFDGEEDKENPKLKKLLKRSHNQLVADSTRADWAKKNLTGKTHSEETKKKWSEAHKGKTISKEHADKLSKGRTENSFQKLIDRISKEDILNAIEIKGNHQNNIIDYLDISFRAYKKLCNHYDIEPPKKSKDEKYEYAVTKQAEPVKVYDCVDGKRGELLYEFRSVSMCCKELKLHKGNMLRNMKNNTPYHNMFFEK